MSAKLEFTSSVVFRMCIACRQPCVFKTLCWLTILAKMRTPGGAKLTDREWKALQATSVDGPQHAHKLANTEHFFQARYTWSVVSLAYSVRSFESAKASGRTLYATRAVDVVQNVSRGQAAAVAEALLSHIQHERHWSSASSHTLGLHHVGMEVRLTQTLAAPHVVVDCIGVIRGFKFAPEDEAVATSTAPSLCCANCQKPSTLNSRTLSRSICRALLVVCLWSGPTPTIGLGRGQ